MLSSNLRRLAYSVIFSMSQFVWSQYTLDNWETHILKPVFDSCIDKEINVIIERYKDSTINRKWIFDESGRLLKEVDLRKSGLSSSMGGQSYSTFITHKEYNYTYDFVGRTKEVVEFTVQDGDTLKRVRKFNYTPEGRIEESFSLTSGLLEKDILKTIYSSKGLKDSTVLTSTSEGTGFFSEWKDKTVFHYDAQNKIKKELSYYKSNFFPLQEGEQPMQYRPSSMRQYEYDKLGRTHCITTYHYDETGISKINKTTTFVYENSTSKIVGFAIPIMNGAQQEDLLLSLVYDEGGCLKRIEFKDGNVYYEYGRYEKENSKNDDQK